MKLSNLLTDWSTLILESFADAGVTDVVLSPGSRSTPFVAAAVRCSRLRLYDCIDERGAAFFALGQARVTGKPSLLVCTSGSAVAHYMPAAVEAGASYTPLIMLTADRPLELHDCAAPQTIDQVKFFGSHARRYFDLGLPDTAPAALEASRRIAAQAVFAARWPAPGAVQVNARARKPLEPAAANSDEGRRFSENVAHLIAQPITSPRPPRLVPDEDDVAELARACQTKPRGVIVCGPAQLAQKRDRDAIFAVASRCGYPILCEAASQLRFNEVPASVTLFDGFATALRSPWFCEQERPQLILQIGAPPTSGAWERFLSIDARIARIVIAPFGWNDPQNAARLMLASDVGETARALARALDGVTLEDAPQRQQWCERHRSANRFVWDAIAAELGREGPLTEGQVAAELVARAPTDSLLSVGNSLAIRLVDTFAQRQKELQVLSQRGANGIDGLIAGAAGAASVAARPVALLVGDVAFLHDLNSLMLARELPQPLVVVVLQNYGGRIFEQLPVATNPAVSDELMRHITTPHDLQLAHAAQMFGHRYARVESRAALGQALDEAYAQRHCTIVEAVLTPHGAAEQHHRLGKAMALLGESVPSKPTE